MERVIGLTVAGAATLMSVGVALLLECLLLKVILGFVAKSRANESDELAPEQSYRELRRPARSRLVSHLG